MARREYASVVSVRGEVAWMSKGGGQYSLAAEFYYVHSRPWNW